MTRMCSWGNGKSSMGLGPGQNPEPCRNLREEILGPPLSFLLLIWDQQSYVATVMVTPALGLITCSLFIQYYFLFRPLRWIRICVWIGVSEATTFYVTVTIFGLVLNTPWRGQSCIENILSHHYIRCEKFAIPTGVIGMVIDWYLLILPVPAVMSLQTSRRKKISILMVFMTGGL